MITKEIEEKCKYMIEVLGIYPKKIITTKGNYKKLVRECLGTNINDKYIFDKNGNAVAPFRGMKIIIDNRINKFVIE